MNYDEDAKALYDGGWRGTDYEELMTEYQLTSKEAYEICIRLEEMENENEK